MFCKYCGKEISDDATFCQYCGGSLVEEKTIISPQHMTVEMVEQRNAPIEDKIRNILKIVIKKLLQLVGIVAIAFASAFIVYHIFMFINKPCSDLDKARALDNDLPNKELLHERGDIGLLVSHWGWGEYKYDKEMTSLGDFANLWETRWYLCRRHANNWSKWSFFIVGTGLLLFFFIRWLYKPKGIEKNVTKEG